LYEYIPTTYYFETLKQYPKHGGTGPDDDAAGAASALKTALQNHEKCAVNTTDSVCSNSNAMSSLLG
jgi:hypothetical protein